MRRRKPRPNGRRRDPPTALKVSTGAFRVLIVDDEPAVAHALRDYLADDGHDVEVALSGAEAVERVTRQRADLVLLDITMPGMSGLEVLQRIKAIDDTIPVVMATANADEGLAQSTLALGAFDYLMKPFEFARLAETIAAARAYGAGGSDAR